MEGVRTGLRLTLYFSVHSPEQDPEVEEDVPTSESHVLCVERTSSVGALSLEYGMDLSDRKSSYETDDSSNERGDPGGNNLGRDRTPSLPGTSLPTCTRSAPWTCPRRNGGTQLNSTKR